MSVPGLNLENLCITYKGARLLHLTARIAPGEVLTVMGPSGVGKSTLLAAITGTLAPGFHLTGDITLNGQDLCALRPEARRVGILFQDDLLFPHMSVATNLGFGLSPAVKGAAARRATISQALSDIGLGGFEKRDPATLSGGQRARVALMRMLLSDPNALLLDEPFSRLDSALRDQIRRLVFSHARQRNLPVLMVTHDIEDARAAAGPIIELTG